MRLWSTRESVRQGEPTILAIVETLACMAGSVWIGVHYATWWHIVVGFCVAPFLLLRTDESCEQTIRWYWRIGIRLLKSSREPSVICHVVKRHCFIVWLYAGGPMTRALATAVQLVKRPGICVGSITDNWWRLSCYTDFATSPELLPLPLDPSPDFTMFVEDEAIELHNRRNYGQWRSLFHELRFGDEPPVATFLIFIYTALPSFIIAVAYRWSIKSTAIGWFPLLWAVKPVKPKDRDWKTHLSIVQKKGMPLLVAILSLLCLLMATIKYGLWAIRYELAANVEAWHAMFKSWAAAGGWKANIAGSPAGEALVNFISPGAIPIWHVTMVCNALLGIFVWWQIRSWLIDYEHNVAPKDESIDRTLAVTFFLRRPLTIYNIVCNGILAYYAASKLPLPVFSSKLFPWW